MRLLDELVQEFLNKNDILTKVENSKVVDLYNLSIRKRIPLLESTKALRLINSILFLELDESCESFEIMMIKNEILKQINNIVKEKNLNTNLVRNIRVTLR
jgi:hypothetical protein